jgi:hypothetical protein
MRMLPGTAVVGTLDRARAWWTAVETAAPGGTAVEEPAGPTGPGRLESQLFYAAVLLQLLPLFLFRHLGTQDGPAHLSTAVELANYWDPAHPIFRLFYTIDFFPNPNLVIQLILTGLVHIVSPETAEKLLVGTYLVAFPLALRLVLHRLNPGATWLSFAGLAFSANHMFLSGFYNFSYGLVVFLLGAAFLLDQRERSPLRYSVGLSLLLLLAYLTHLIPAVELVLLAGAIAVTPILTAWARRERPLAQHLHQLLLTGVAVVPLALLSLLFVLRTGFGETYHRDNPLKLLIEVPTLALPLVGLNRMELIPTALMAGLLIWLAGLFLRQQGTGVVRGMSGSLALAFTLSYLLCLIAPEETAQGGAINTRLSIFPPLFLLLWLSGFRPSRRLRAGVVAALLVFAGGLMVLRLPTQLRHDGDLEAYARASRLVRPGSTIVGFQLVSEDQTQVRTFSDATLHGPGLVAALRQGVDVGDYQAITSYFPTRFRPGANIRQRIDSAILPGGRGGGGLSQTPPTVDLLGLPSGHKTNPEDRIDYVLVRGDVADVPAPARERAQQFLSQVNSRYRLLASFAGSVPLYLYERQ